MISQDKLNIIFNKIINLDNNIIQENPEKIRNINECIEDLYNLINNLENEENIREFITRKKIFNTFFPYMYFYKMYLDNK